MEDEVRKELKSFDDVLVLLNDMIQNIDELMKMVDDSTGREEVNENKNTKDHSP